MKMIAIVLAVVIVLVVAVGLWRIVEPGAAPGPLLASAYSGMVPAEKLMRVPVTGIYPGGSAEGLAPDMKNPLSDDPDAVARGARDFDSFNCSGCHMARGGGGMGPSLSNDIWIYRSSPANIYLSIAQGRSAGMPAFGAMLPDRTIWELAAYIESISAKPGAAFGSTTSVSPQMPDTEQVPAEKNDTTTPWAFTEPMPPHGGEPGTAQPARN